MDVEQLIEEVRKFPVLYDQTHERYRNTEYKERIWKQIAIIILKSRDGDKCKKKWFHMRNQLRKTLKKRKTVSGQSVYHRKYKYEDLMDFLVPYLGELETVSNMSYLEECGENLHDPESVEDIQEGFSVEQDSEQNSNKEDELEIQSHWSPTESWRNSCQSSQSFSSRLSPTIIKKDFLKPKSLKRKIIHHEAMTELAASYLMAFILAEKDAKESVVEGTNKDPVDTFLASLAPSLKSLNPILLNQAKSGIFSIVQEFEMKQLMGYQGPYEDYQIAQNILTYSSSSGSSPAMHPSTFQHQSNYPKSGFYQPLENEEQTPEQSGTHQAGELCSTEYNPALSSLSWLFGIWESVEAEVSYPTIDTLKYNEVMEFLPTMQPLLEYKSDTWHPVKKTKMHCEKGFLRIDPESKNVAFMVSHNFGLTELSEGSVENESLYLESQSISRMSFSKNAVTVKLVRKLVLIDGDLYSTVLMETTNQPLQTHLQCRYKKKK